MAERRAIVLEREGVQYILLTREGEFIRAHLPRDAAVGEEIELPGRVPVRWFKFVAFKPWGLAGFAALLIFVLIFTLNWNLLLYSQAVAAVSLDINPRLELTLNKKSTILDVFPINAEAEALVKDLKLKGESLSTGLREIIQAAKEHNYLNQEQGWVVVGLSPVEDSTPLPATLTLEVIEQTIIEEANNLGISGKVAAIPVTSEERDQALTEGLTTAEYGLYQIAKHAGLEVSPDTVRDTAQRSQLLEKEEIQAEIKNKAANFYSALQQWQQDKAKAESQRNDNHSSDSTDGSNRNRGNSGDTGDNSHLNKFINLNLNNKNLNGLIKNGFSDFKGFTDWNGFINSQDGFTIQDIGDRNKALDILEKYGETPKSRGENGADGLKSDWRNSQQSTQVNDRSGSTKDESRAGKDEIRNYLKEEKKQGKDPGFDQNGNRGNTQKNDQLYTKNKFENKYDTKNKFDINNKNRAQSSSKDNKQHPDCERNRRQSQDLRSSLEKDLRINAINSWLRWFERF